MDIRVASNRSAIAMVDVEVHGSVSGSPGLCGQWRWMAFSMGPPKRRTTKRSTMATNASTQWPSPQVTPSAAVSQIVAAVVRPRMRSEDHNSLDAAGCIAIAAYKLGRDNDQCRSEADVRD